MHGDRTGRHRQKALVGLWSYPGIVATIRSPSPMDGSAGAWSWMHPLRSECKADEQIMVHVEVDKADSLVFIELRPQLAVAASAILLRRRMRRVEAANQLSSWAMQTTEQHAMTAYTEGESESAWAERSQLPSTPTDRKVMEALIVELEELLDAEYCTDGNRTTAFARGWLGLPLPEERYTSQWREQYYVMGAEKRASNQ
jgi:hypothetical protein